MKSPVILGPGVIIFCFGRSLLTPGLDYTRLFISLTAGAGTRCMCLLSSSPSLLYVLFLFRLGEMKRETDTCLGPNEGPNEDLAPSLAAAWVNGWALNKALPWGPSSH